MKKVIQILFDIWPALMLLSGTLRWFSTLGVVRRSGVGVCSTALL